MKTLSTLILATIFAFACGKKDDDNKSGAPPPTEPGTRADPDLDKAEVASADVMPDSAALEAYMRATSAAVDAAGADCAKLAGPVIDLATKNADLLAKMAATSDSDAAKQWKSENAELYAGFRKAMAAVAACARQDPKLIEVLKSLSPKKPAPPPAAKPE